MIARPSENAREYSAALSPDTAHSTFLQWDIPLAIWRLSLDRAWENMFTTGANGTETRDIDTQGGH